MRDEKLLFPQTESAWDWVETPARRWQTRAPESVISSKYHIIPLSHYHIVLQPLLLHNPIQPAQHREQNGRCAE